MRLLPVHVAVSRPLLTFAGQDGYILPDAEGAIDLWRAQSDGDVYGISRHLATLRKNH